MKPTLEFHRYVAEAYSPEIAEDFLRQVGRRRSLSYADAMHTLDRVLLGGGKPIAPVFGRTGSLPVALRVPKGIRQAIAEDRKRTKKP